jgi:hypothetical protein
LIKLIINCVWIYGAIRIAIGSFYHKREEVEEFYLFGTISTVKNFTSSLEIDLLRYVYYGGWKPKKWWW